VQKNLPEQVSEPLLNWYNLYGRSNLPWQQPRTPYRVWISEIMLQQTQVHTVIDYFNRFVARFSNITDLAQANEDEVFSLWSGLGYYTRARNLHRTAQIVAQNYAGVLPNEFHLLLELPGIGESTAAAIMSQAFNQPVAILDGNVKRVLSRYFMVEGHSEQAQVKRTLWKLANSCMPKENCAQYTQAIMDLGALCCTSKNPNCGNCPLQTNCLALQHNQQHLYPTKKVKKHIPIHQQQVLVLYNNQDYIYLEKRPPNGIWGSLWCLPSLDTNDCPLDFIRQKYNLLGQDTQQLLAFKHRFTHFHLEINALRIQTKTLGSCLAEPSGRWFTQEEINFLGIAKPTSKILAVHFGKK
jgi:A/G-specific adenine glycosylase